MLKPLFPRFNVAVLHLASLTCPRGFDVRPDDAVRDTADERRWNTAPQTYAEQVAWFKKHGRPCVDSRNSDLTIYGDPEVNLAFRGWHEATHLRLQAAFTPDGEQRVARAQIADVAKLYGAREAEMFASIIWCEVVTQAEELARTGRFPADQRAFTLARLPAVVVRTLGGHSDHPRGWETAGGLAAA